MGRRARSAGQRRDKRALDSKVVTKGQNVSGKTVWMDEQERRARTQKIIERATHKR